MKKRLVSILLVLVMVLGMLPTVAFAADTPTSIKSAQEFADMTAGGNYILTKDIEISTPYTNFSGTFDGNGHTITLKITANQNYTGLFTSLQGMSGGTTVKNLLLDGTIDNTANYNRVAAVAGGASALNGPITVENCKSAVTITGSGSYIAGIVGYCSNNSSSKGLLQILNCANTGSVSGKGNVGGIAGNLTGGAHAIQNCYNTGSVAATGNNVAGIVGWVADGVSITNCYTVGALPQSGTVSAIANCYQVGSGSAVNCYALEGTATELTTKVTLDDKSAFKTESEMKSADFAALLGDGFMAKAGSYPTLAWEVPTASKTFHITPAAATLTVLKGSETAYSGTGAEQTVSLPAGTYTYTVSCAGYETKNGDAFTVFREGGERRRDAFGGYRLFE